MFLAIEFLSSWIFWVWLGIMVVTIVLEAITPSDLVSIWFAAGAFVAMIMSIFLPTKYAWIEVIAFLVVSMVLVCSTRKLAKKLQDTPEIKTNIDGVVGQTGKVTIEILPHEVGEVKVEGKLWSAISEGKIEKGAYVEVLAVEGVKLVVKELEEN